MAAPTAPDLDSLTTEALKKAGYASPSTAQLSRAQDEWIEEVKNDIWLLGKRLKSLQAEHVEVLNPGQSRYNFPSGFSSILDAKILYGDDKMDVQDSSSSTLTLDADETEGEDEIEGKEILIYSGTGKASLSQVKSFSDTTLIAQMSPTWGTTPIAGDTYVIVDLYIPLELKSISHFDEIALPYEQGPPNILYQIGDENHYGYYRLFPVPDDDYYYAIHFNYYINLLTLDLASTRMTTLYQRWRNLWIQGVKARQLESDDDDRAANEMTRYFNMVRDTVRLETYGRNIKSHFTGVRA